MVSGLILSRTASSTAVNSSSSDMEVFSGVSRDNCVPYLSPAHIQFETRITRAYPVKARRYRLYNSAAMRASYPGGAHKKPGGWAGLRKAGWTVGGFSGG